MAAYGKSVFVNCPFDADYRPMFRAMVFTIEFCGFTARCALEVDDAGESRLEKIIRLIRDSKFGIHDVSRTELNAHGLPRFNMPYEFGIFTGLKASADEKQSQKRILVLDREQYRYQQFLSDIAGQDIRHHSNDPDRLIGEVRHWLRNQVKRELPGGQHICDRFHTFQADLPGLLGPLNMTDADLENYVDYRRLVVNWIGLNAVA
jgi:hypothetical protein